MKSKQISKEELGDLHQNEIDLLWYIRNVYRFGKVEIECRDGLPQDLIKTIERTRLGQGNYQQRGGLTPNPYAV